MIVTKLPVSGALWISDLINNELVTRVYYGYSRRDAMRLFKAEMREKK